MEGLNKNVHLIYASTFYFSTMYSLYFHQEVKEGEIIMLEQFFIDGVSQSVIK